MDTSSEADKHEPMWMSERFACIDCGISLPPVEPRMFSFNGPHGACPACDGIGARTRIDPGSRGARSAAHAARGRGGGLGPARVALARHRDRARRERAGRRPGRRLRRAVRRRAAGHPLRHRRRDAAPATSPAALAARRRGKPRPRTRASSPGSSGCSPPARSSPRRRPTRASTTRPWARARSAASW